ncbi:MAG: hypothetical protein HKP31_08270 [Nitrosopumilus sp.]|nr:hypothetical protein [Nitrosopumilus sp.]
MENKSLVCPVCGGNKADMLGKNVKLSGQFENKEFLTTKLTVLKCVQCGFYMFFDNTAEFTAND